MNSLPVRNQQDLDALRSAVAEALERKRRLGQYAVISNNGRAVRLEPEEMASSEAAGQSHKSA